MERLPWILGFSVVGSLGGVLAAAVLLLLPDGPRRRLLPALVSYATGALLGAAFLGMLPEAIERGSAQVVLGSALGGVVLFFVLEKVVLWHHCHDEACAEHQRAAPLILAGDAMHNFVDGIVIAAAFLASVPVGISTALAVLAHEIPQELGDFAILLDAGYSRRKALLWNVLASTTTFAGALIAYFALRQMVELMPVMLGVAAGSLLYVAAADLIPGLHRHTALRATFSQVVLVLVGVGTVAALRGAH